MGVNSNIWNYPEFSAMENVVMNAYLLAGVGTALKIRNIPLSIYECVAAVALE